VNYSEDISKLTRNIPNSRLGDLHGDNTSNTNILGSTQLGGCKGEFCNFDTKFLEINDDAATSTNTNTNYGVSSGSSSTSSGNGSSSSGKHTSEFRKRLIARNDRDGFEEVEEINSLISDLMISAKTTNTNTTTNTPLYKLPLKSIIQARQEMDLVKLQLRRHMYHEKGDYVSEENFNDFAMSNKLPAHYYQEVLVCQTCFKVREGESLFQK